MSKYVLAIIKYKRLKRTVKSNTFFFENGRDYKEDTTRAFIATEWDGNNWDNAEYTNLVEWYLLTKDDPKYQEAYYRKCVTEGNSSPRSLVIAMLEHAQLQESEAKTLLVYLKSAPTAEEVQTHGSKWASRLLTHENYKVRVLASIITGWPQ